jgi:hypothetical protein
VKSIKIPTLVGAALVFAALVLFAACSGTSTSNNARSFTSDDGTFTLQYPADYQPVNVSDGKTIFSEDTLDPEVHDIGSITILSMKGSVEASVVAAKALYQSGYSETPVEVAGVTGLKLTGVLNDWIIGWGGLPYTHILLPKENGSLQIEYDSGTEAVRKDIEIILSSLEFRK